jgi:hypothetical protein
MYRLQVLKAVAIKCTDLPDVTPCSVVKLIDSWEVCTAFSQGPTSNTTQATSLPLGASLLGFTF